MMKRTAHPKCGVIEEIRDQANFGGSWALGTVGVMSDRVFISSGQADQRRLDDKNILAFSFHTETDAVVAILHMLEILERNWYCYIEIIWKYKKLSTLLFTPCDH